MNKQLSFIAATRKFKPSWCEDEASEDATDAAEDEDDEDAEIAGNGHDKWLTILDIIVGMWSLAARTVSVGSIADAIVVGDLGSLLQSSSSCFQIYEYIQDNTFNADR